MKSAKEFAQWLSDRLDCHPQGVYFTKQDIRELSGRQHFSPDFIHDIHHEMAKFGLGFVIDPNRVKYYLFHLPKTHWIEIGDRYQQSQPSPTNIHPMPDQVQR